MTAERLVQLLVLGLAEHHDVAQVRQVQTMYRDRLAVAVEDHGGALWRVQVLREPTL